jgi:hypothetical protein
MIPQGDTNNPRCFSWVQARRWFATSSAGSARCQTGFLASVENARNRHARAPGEVPA